VDYTSHAGSLEGTGDPGPYAEFAYIRGSGKKRFGRKGSTTSLYLVWDISTPSTTNGTSRNTGENEVT